MEKQEDFLWNVLKNINAWLEFAEKKNFQLVSFLGVGIFGASILRIGLPNLKTFYDIWSFKIFILFSIVSWLLAVWSFLPKTIPPYTSKHKIVNNPNYLFYGTLAYKEISEIQKVYIENYGLDKINSILLKDFIEQIKTNSEISLRKFCCFKLGAFSLIIALIFFSITLVVYYAK